MCARTSSTLCPATCGCMNRERRLVSGPTGVEVISRLAAAAAKTLAPGGWLVVEVGPSTATAAEQVIAAHAELVSEPTIKDLAGLPRIVQARRRG